MIGRLVGHALACPYASPQPARPSGYLPPGSAGGNASPGTGRAREILCSSAMVSAHDAVHAAVVFHHGVERIATFDRGFEKVEVIRQIRLP